MKKLDLIVTGIIISYFLVVLVYALAPSIGSVDLIPNPNTNYTDSNISIINNSVSDPDGDQVSTTFNWFENNESMAVLNMPFDSNGSEPAKDYTPYNNSGAVSGAFFNATGGADGYGAYEFDGVNDMITASTILDITKEGNYSFSFLAYLYEGNESGVFQNSIDTNNRNGAYFTTSGALRFGYYNGSDYISKIKNAYFNQWMHFVLINSDGSLYIYMDGELTTPSTSSNSLSGTTGFYLGRSGNANQYFMNGSIDNVMIFNRTLSADEILLLYNSFGRMDKLHSDATTVGNTYMAQACPTEAKDEGIDGVCVNSSVMTILNAPPSIPILNLPENNSIFNSISQFNWNNSSDIIDNQDLTYLLEIDNNIDFSSPEYRNTSISETTNTTGDTPSGLSDDIYYWRVLANDGTDNSSWSEIREFTYDRASPLITWVTPNNNNLTKIYSSFRTDITITDTNLFAINISIYNLSAFGAENYLLYENTTIDYNSTSFVFNEFFDTSNWTEGSYLVVVHAEDDHTLEKIPNYNIEKSKDNILFENTAGVRLIDYNISIKSDVNTEKIYDRYSFSFDVDDTEKKYEVICNDELYYRGNSKYKAHFVCGKYWLDFENEENAEVKVIEDKGIYYVLTRGKTFNSFGGLNIVEESATFEYVILNPISATNIFIILFIIIILYIIGRGVEDPVFIMMSGFMFPLLAIYIGQNGIADLGNTFIQTGMIILFWGIGVYLIVNESIKMMGE